MRITDERYHRDRLRYDLALRMIGHEARTCTIRHWTGLSDDRIRRLYKTYVEYESPTPVRRHRGKSPQQPGYFLRTQATQFEATLLAIVLGSTGLLSRSRGRGAARGLEFATRFCDAYETYLALSRQTVLSFEHACLLLQALERGEEICLWSCPRCSGPYLRDVLAIDPAACPLCRIKRPNPAGAIRRGFVPAIGRAPVAQGIQQGEPFADC
jgi:hypothetical protein